MSDTSRDTGKSMWDLVSELEDEAEPTQAVPHETPIADAGEDDADYHDAFLTDQSEPAPTPQSNAAAAPPEAPKRKTGGFLAVVIAVLAIGASAFFYMQGSQSVAGSTTAVTAVQAKISPAVYTADRVRFSDPLKSASPRFSGKSLAELATGTPTVSPIPDLPVANWSGAECSSCHTWTQARLCDQGKWYEQHGKRALDRIDHPYGGEFKRSLVTWASQSCL